MEIKAGTLRVWHIANPPKDPFTKIVKNIKEAEIVLNIIWNYDLYLGDAVSSNASGIEIFEEIDGEMQWSEYYNDNGEDVSEFINFKKQV